MIHLYTVYVDGVMQHDHEYSIINDRIMFRDAPSALSTITIVDGIGQDIKITHRADGSTLCFATPEQSAFDRLIVDLTKYRDHPSVKDMIERLQVVLALIKTNTNND